MSLIPEEKIFADLYSGLVNYKNEFYRRYDLVMEQQTEAFKRGQVPENWIEGDQEAFRSYPGNENKTVFNTKTVISDELISSGKLNIWANEAANNIYYIKDNKGYGLSNNGIVFEFIEPKIPGETFIFYPTLGNPTK